METQTANNKGPEPVCICQRKGLKLDDKALFIYIGQGPHVYFFLHVHSVARTPGLVAEMCVGVFDTMVHETMIRPGDNILVFSRSTEAPTKIMPVRVTHKDFTPVSYTSGRLGAIYKDILEDAQNTGEETMVAVVELSDGTPVRYGLGEIPNIFTRQGRIMPVGSIEPEALQLGKIVDMRSGAVIDYLGDVPEGDNEGPEAESLGASDGADPCECTGLDEDTEEFLASIGARFREAPLDDAIRLLTNPPAGK